jgi:uncharacterized MAPEG superfamily protein
LQRRLHHQHQHAGERAEPHQAAHGILYLANIHAMRSLVWFGAFACVLVLMVQAALQIAI